jgi:hypothetical protein
MRKYGGCFQRQEDERAWRVVKERLKEALLRLERTVIPSTVIVSI